MSKLVKVAICRAVDKPSTPIPITRHIVTPYAFCRDVENVAEIPGEVIEAVYRKRSVVLDRDSAKKLLGLDIDEDEYVKIYIAD